ncbi:hypothetical protein [Acinetobacter sp. V89_7]|uniref:hypothetical protein n=1 Tax=Acinetobacter sp. V89_7 TaxID=3044233 RepID=UPI00249F86BD|nr:hypothetical protein [Acinetobacter sp. V89_7]MDI3379276.1 hypothetical protein [Acinetobacter sp. V89_7]
MDKCKHGFDHACLICGFTHIDGKKVWFDWAWQEQQKQIDELNQNNEKLRLDHAAYKKGVKNIIQEKLKQIEGRNFTIAAMERSFVLANAKVDELQARIQAATAKWISIASILAITESNVPDVIYKQLDELHDALCGFEPEQALKGGEV